MKNPIVRGTMKGNLGVTHTSSFIKSFSDRFLSSSMIFSLSSNSLKP